MNIKEKAKLFAIKAHMGQIRKNEPDKPKIMHPILVGNILEVYGYDDNLIAAGYLHDVVEDTKYTIEDIEREFGSDIASLVMGASEPDKSLSWEERKIHTIKEIRNLPIRNKLVVCADKIANLEDLYLKFEKSGNRDFSAFKRGEEKQKWYYTSIYESVVYGEYEDLPIFVRLKNVLDKLFLGKEDLFLKDTIFKDDEDYYAKLKKLHAEKLELLKLKELVTISKPFVIEFAGTPRTGKTSIINNLYDFFKKGSFNVSLVEEFTTSKYYKEKLKPEFNKMNICDKHIAINEEVYKQLCDVVKDDKDIILIDRSLNDRQIWNHRCFINGNMQENIYLETREKYTNLSKELIDYLVVTYTDSLTSLKRDYNSSLALENRSFLNINNIDDYNNNLLAVQDLFKSSVDEMTFIDTTNISMRDASVEIASQILPVIRKRYINEFKKKYNIK